MKKEVLEQLQAFKTKEKFPVEEWSRRGLEPSSASVRKKMNEEVNDFIDYIERRLEAGAESMQDEIQEYMNEWDSYDFDMEETEYMVDVMCKVMRMVNVNCSDILI